MRFLAILAFLLFLPLPAIAAEALSGDTIKFDDGRIVRLTGIKSPAHALGDQARAYLQSLITDRVLNVENATQDRYGRIAGDVTAVADKSAATWLQGEMLRAGLAFVYPPTGDEPRLDDLLKLEHTARQAKQGIWNDPAYADEAAEPPGMGYGRFAFVSGKVVKAERVKNKLYLNFGEDWRTDFTIAVAAHDLHLFRKAGIDPLDYQNKIIRVRGWIKRDFGPMITVTHPSQIEILGIGDRGSGTGN
jgi:micrococcal nuclease